MMNIWTIGLIGPGRPFNRLLAMLLFVLLGCSCGTTSTVGQHRFYYDEEVKARVYEIVDEYPLYNDEVWIIGLSKDFNKHFSYRFRVDEEIKTTIVAEIILDKNGVIVSSRLLQDEDTDFGMEALRVLRECNKWSPGKVNGKAVYTKLFWKTVY